jgi:hypothetical protein
VGYSRRWLAQVVSVIEAEQAVRAMSCKLVELAELGPGDTVLDAARTGSQSRSRCC